MQISYGNVNSYYLGIRELLIRALKVVASRILVFHNHLTGCSVVEQMIAMIPEEDWTDQVQIIGWLYQYYNTEPKDQVLPI